MSSACGAAIIYAKFDYVSCRAKKRSICQNKTLWTLESTFDKLSGIPSDFFSLYYPLQFPTHWCKGGNTVQLIYVNKKGVNSPIAEQMFSL